MTTKMRLRNLGFVIVLYIIDNFSDHIVKWQNKGCKDRSLQVFLNVNKNKLECKTIS